MEIDELDFWDIIPKENLKEGCKLKCPECGEWSIHKEWKEGSVYCELCGDHSAIVCPHCNEHFDHVWSKPFECKA